VLALAAQGRWLERRYPRSKVGFSLPRLRPAAGMTPPKITVTDREYGQALMALRHWMPAADISLSTRETAAMRDGLIPLVVTKISAGSCTSVGGYGEHSRTEGQFEISDDRDLKTMCALLARKGLDPVLTDWVPLRGGPVHA
jgi:2-iminoacetate synthase